MTDTEKQIEHLRKLEYLNGKIEALRAIRDEVHTKLTRLYNEVSELVQSNTKKP